MDLPGRRSAAFEALVEPTRDRAALWRLVVGLGLASAVWLAAAAALFGLVARLPLGPAAEPRVFALGYLFSFAGLLLGLALARRLLHRGGLASLAGRDRKAIFRDFGRGLGLVALVILLALPLTILGDRPERQLGLGLWLAWLPIGLAAILIQIAAEELVFRGYLQGGLAARFRSPLIWLLVPALLFGALHWNPPAFGPNAWLAVVAATLIGLAVGDATARRGNLGLAMGIHFANNAYALLVVAAPSPLSGLALFLSQVDGSDPAGTRLALLGNIAVVAIAYAAWILLRRPPPAELHSSGPASI